MPAMPSGAPLKRSVDVASVDFWALFDELRAKKFTGYVCITIATPSIEEGCLVFDGGKPVAAMYEYQRHKKVFYAAQALPRIMNATAAAHGVLDIYQLTSEQLQLTLAFNERAVYVPGAAEFRPAATFSTVFEEEAVEYFETREAIMARVGLGELAVLKPPRELPKPEPTPAPLEELKRK